MLCNFDITFDIKNISEIRNFPQVPVLCTASGNVNKLIKMQTTSTVKIGIVSYIVLNRHSHMEP
jgi:hypothetical protein